MEEKSLATILNLNHKF